MYDVLTIQLAEIITAVFSAHSVPRIEAIQIMARLYTSVICAVSIAENRGKTLDFDRVYNKIVLLGYEFLKQGEEKNETYH